MQRAENHEFSFHVYDIFKREGFHLDLRHCFNDFDNVKAKWSQNSRLLQNQSHLLSTHSLIADRTKMVLTENFHQKTTQYLLKTTSKLTTRKCFKKYLYK